MCGIWGSIGYEPPRSVIDVIAHRGPDGEGRRSFASPAGAVALAHRRLAIIDTSEAGAQPMRAHGEDVWITYNGEVYNYRELRAELTERGHAFRTGTDTEVILAAYLEWGVSCLDRLNGMFAFVLFDQRKNLLLAARDRFGIKPLYVHADRRGICFASEIKQFFQLPEVGRKINEARAVDFLVGGITDHRRDTLFQGVQHVRAGEYLAVDLNAWRPGDVCPPGRTWYQLPAPGSAALKGCEAVGRYRLLLEDAVRLQMFADVRRGITLSGGLDSSSVACIVRKHLAGVPGAQPGEWTSFSDCYEEPEVDERKYLDAVVAKVELASQRVCPVAEDVFPLLDKLVWHMDEPFGGTSPVAQWKVFEQARRAGVYVLLGGQGADEQLGGYQHMLAARRRELAERRERVAAGTIWGSAPAPGSASQVFEPPAWLRPELRPSDREWPGAPSLEEQRNLGLLCVQLITRGSLPMLLRFEDRDSMAHSVEARVPFLDHRLVEYTVGLGSEYKVVRLETKHLLRRGMSDLLPPLLLRRPDKMGFTTPENAWLHGPLRSIVEESVTETARQWPRLFELQGVEDLLHRAFGERSVSPLVPWRIMCFGRWAQCFGMQ